MFREPCVVRSFQDHSAAYSSRVPQRHTTLKTLRIPRRRSLASSRFSPELFTHCYLVEKLEECRRQEKRLCSVVPSGTWRSREEWTAEQGGTCGCRAFSGSFFLLREGSHPMVRCVAWPAVPGVLFCTLITSSFLSWSCAAQEGQSRSQEWVIVPAPSLPALVISPR